MTATVELPAARESRTAGANETHVYCCDPDLSLCGIDLSRHTEVGDNVEITCVVCAELNEIDRACSPGCPGSVA